MSSVGVTGAVDGGNGRDELEAQDVEEATVARPLPTPDTPTRSEVLDHCVTHTPYRSWCKHCREGRGRESPHSSHQHGPRAAPTVSFDYAYVGDKGEIVSREQAETEEGSVTILVVRDSATKAVFGHVVPQKGIDAKQFAVDELVKDIVWLGHTKVMLKSDNETAILKLLTEALRELRIQGLENVMSENSPEYDPQANGSAEVGVQIVKGMVRTHRSGLEEELGHRVPARHPLIAWLVRHAANIVNWTVTGADGKTAYQRARSKPFTTRLLRFGEKCSYKTRAQEPLSPTGDGQGWHQGTFLSISVLVSIWCTTRATSSTPGRL